MPKRTAVAYPLPPTNLGLIYQIPPPPSYSEGDHPFYVPTKYKSEYLADRLDDTCKKDKAACKAYPQKELDDCKKKKMDDCLSAIRVGVKLHCNTFRDSPACDFLPPPTSTTQGSKMLPFIIGGVAGIIVLLAIGIGLFCYCRAKKKMGGQSKTQGLNTSGTTVNSGTATGTTATGANGIPPLQNPPPPYNGEMF